MIGEVRDDLRRPPRVDPRDHRRGARQAGGRAARRIARGARRRVGHLVPRPRVHRARRRQAAGRVVRARSAPTRTSATSTRRASRGCARRSPSTRGSRRSFTTIGRSVAICTNGTRVLGLGDIGPLASLPVMEGKAIFYAQLVGVSAWPILIDTTDVDEFVETVARIAPGVRRDPPRGHLRSGVLRDRAPADRGARQAGDARRRPRDGGRDAGGGDRGVPAGRAAPRPGGDRADRARRGGLRDRDADQGRRRGARAGVRPEPGRGRACGRARDRAGAAGGGHGDRPTSSWPRAGGRG